MQTVPPAPPRRRRRWRRIALAGLAIAALAVCAAQPLAQAVLRAAILATIEREPGLRASLGLVEISFLQGTLRLHDLRIERGGADETGQVPMALELTTVDASPSWRDLVRGRIVTDLTIGRPRLILLASDADGGDLAPDAPWSGWLRGARLSTPLLVRRLLVHDGVVVWRRRDPASTLRLAAIEIDGRDLGTLASRPGSVRATGLVTGDGELEVVGSIDARAPRLAAELGIILRGLRIEAFDPLLRRALDLETQHGRLDAYAEVALADGVLSGFIKPLVSDLDLSDVSENLHRHGLSAAISSSAASAASRLLADRHGDITARVPLQARLDRPGGFGAVSEALRAALSAATRRIPVLELRLGLQAWRDREWRLALDALRVRGQVWRYGVGLAARRDQHRSAITGEAVFGPGFDVGKVRIELLPRIAVGGARDRGESGVVLAYGVDLDATYALGPAVVGLRAGWTAEAGFGAVPDAQGPLAGISIGWRF